MCDYSKFCNFPCGRKFRKAIFLSNDLTQLINKDSTILFFFALEVVDLITFVSDLMKNQKLKLNHMKKFLLTLVLVMAVAISASSQNIYQLVQSSPDHTTLAAAIDAANLQAALEGPGPFTLFAPTDAAFDALPEGLVEALLLDPEEVLRDILLYHVVPGSNPTGSFTNGENLTSLLSGQQLTITIDGTMFMVNGALMSPANIGASNGIIHSIDAVLIPDVTTVYDVVVESEDHNTLEAAINAAGLDVTLDGPGAFTLFAPTDAAFDLLPANLVNALLEDPEGVLSDVLLYHAVGSIAISSSLGDGDMIETLLGQDVTVSLTGGVFINNAEVTVADIPTINGVVHVVNAVLIPETTTVFDIVEGSEDHTTLETAIVAAELDGTLSDPGAYTLFAPTDAAFEALPQGVLDILLSDPTGALADVLLFHVADQIALAGDLTDGQTIPTIFGEDVTVTIEDENVFINGALVTVANLPAINGVVHVIDAVLVPTGAICTDFDGGPYTNFNTVFGGAPSPENGVCPVFQITGFEAWASESYTVDNFTAGQEYTFSICEGPGAGSWDPELTVFDPDGNLIAIAADCEITWVAPVDGTYIIGIQEIGFCADESPNLATNNGFPTLSCTSDNTIFTIIANSEDHNTLEAALLAADLAGVLAGEEEYTVFAPTDAAFEAIDAVLLEALLADPEGLLSDILLYHVAEGTTLSGDLSDGQVITTVNGQDVTITIDGANVMVNDAMVTVADLTADNGVVHVIDAVLLPSVLTTVYDIVVDSPDHTTLETAIDLAGLDGALSGDAGNVTLFAPTDDAFDNLPDGVLDALLADPEGDLAEVLLYHVVEGFNISANLSDGDVATLFGEEVTISIDGDNVMVNDAMVTVADLVAINGVVHVIDAVLVPTTLNVDNIAAVESFSVFPNPANDIISLELEMISSERITIDFVNMLGQVVKTVDLGQRSTGLNREQIDIEDMADGFYLMNITIGQGDQLTQKLQVVR